MAIENMFSDVTAAKVPVLVSEKVRWMDQCSRRSRDFRVLEGGRPGDSIRVERRTDAQSSSINTRFSSIDASDKLEMFMTGLAMDAIWLRSRMRQLRGRYQNGTAVSFAALQIVGARSRAQRGFHEQSPASGRQEHTTYDQKRTPELL